jgi:transcriptional regulator with XRE-family HTH domain
MDPAHLIRSARRRAGLSLRELAARSATSHATLAAYEQGRKVPRADTMLRILEAAGTELVPAPVRRADHSLEARRAKGDELVQPTGHRRPSHRAPASIAWLVANNNRRVRYRGVERNRIGLSTRVAAINLPRLLNLGLHHSPNGWAIS